MREEREKQEEQKDKADFLQCLELLASGCSKHGSSSRVFYVLEKKIWKNGRRNYGSFLGQL